MLTSILQEMLERALLQLRKEINLYPDEQTLWAVRGNIYHLGQVNYHRWLVG